MSNAPRPVMGSPKINLNTNVVDSPRICGDGCTWQHISRRRREMRHNAGGREQRAASKCLRDQIGIDAIVRARSDPADWLIYSGHVACEEMMKFSEILT